MGLPGSAVHQRHVRVNLEVALVSLILRIANFARDKRLVLDASIRNDSSACTKESWLRARVLWPEKA